MLKRGKYTLNHNLTKLITLVFISIFTVSCFSKGNSKSSTGGSTSSTATSTSTTSTDTTAPTGGSISTDAITNLQSITVNLSASEAVSLPMQMCVGESVDCSSCTYEAYAASKVVALSGGIGNKNLSVKYKDAVGNESACYTTTTLYEQLTVTPRYTGTSEWTKYVQSADTSQLCAGTETHAIDCIHVGDKKRVTTAEVSCTGLAMTDAKGIFDWTCSIVGGFATFDSALKDGKGLKDAIDFDNVEFYANQVTLTGGTPANQKSYSQAWWSNTIEMLTDAAQTERQVLTSDSIYLANSASMDFYGAVFKSGNAALVQKANTRLTHVANAAVCNLADGDEGPDSCIVSSASGMNFNWIELEEVVGDYSTTTSAHGIVLYNNYFATVLNTSISYLNEYGLRMDNVYSSKIKNLRISNVTGASSALTIVGGSYNIFNSINISNSNNPMYITGSSQAQYFQNLILNGSTDGSLNIDDSATGLHFTQTTIMNNRYGFQYDHVSSSVMHNLVAVNSYGSNAFTINSSANNTFSQIAIDNTSSFSMNIANEFKFTGVVMLTSGTNCIVANSTNPGIRDATCGNQGDSNSDRENLNFQSDFAGKVTTDDALNESDTNGTFTYSNGEFSDFINFENFYRAYGMGSIDAFPNPSHVGTCLDGVLCQIWDASLRLAGTSIFKRSENPSAGVNDAFTNGDACPGILVGDNALTDQLGSQTYLKNAVEIIADDIGNENGLCESNETCLYTPNFGAYQGHGTLGSCTFTDGAVSGVTMKGYLSNGY